MKKPENPNKEQGFISRWSKRKQAAIAGEAGDEQAAEISAEQAAELKANQMAAEAIDIDTLDYDSDFSAFFKDGVPALLRQKAMRILWRSNPILANVDGLCDYDENFADPSLILHKYESAYRIGKGYAFDNEENEDHEDVDNESEEELELETQTEQEEPIEDTKDMTDGTQLEEDTPPIRPHVSLRERLKFDS